MLHPPKILVANEGLFANQKSLKFLNELKYFEVFKISNNLNSQDFRTSGIFMCIYIYITWLNEIVPKDLSMMYM